MTLTSVHSYSQTELVPGLSSMISTTDLVMNEITKDDKGTPPCVARVCMVNYSTRKPIRI